MSDNRISDFSAPQGDRWPFEVSAPASQPNLPVQAAGCGDIYAVAWSLAQRDHELDRLFNAAFYYEI